jgi:hypothetical protein
VDPDYYDYEAHIFFDDAMVHKPNGDVQLNNFVSTIFTIIAEAAS